jgi:radical SAM/Cys-rich protein
MRQFEFTKSIKESGVDFSRNQVSTVQVNIGKLCNQACLHCHVEAGPHKKRENMVKKTVERILTLIDSEKTVETVDITGGAPELNPYFRFFVKELRSRGIKVLNRCNLTVLFEDGQEDTAKFLAENGVEIVASLPCYSSDNVDKQRGDGVFDKSIKGLQLFNSFGYGKEGSGLNLDLVYNPVGAHLPPAQAQLEADYKIKLKNDFDIEFNSLYCITNMPIKRFLFDLKRNNNYENYMQLLLDNFNPYAAQNVMCRDLVSISWDGQVFDCDFNQMLEIPLGYKKTSIFDIESFSSVVERPIAVDSHCFGCTAGAGSSCGGTTV